MTLPMLQATPSELATLQKMVAMSVLAHLENRETSEVRKIVDGANALFIVISGWTEIYNEIQALITRIDNKRKQEIEERELQRLKDMMMAFMGAAQLREQPQEQPKPAEHAVLPPELSSDKAMKLWEILQGADLIDSNYQPLVSRPLAALIAGTFFTVLDMEVQWALFENLWHRKNMRNDHSKAMNGKKKHKDFLDKLNKLIITNSNELGYVHPGAQRVHL